MVGTETYVIESPGGETGEVELPEGLVDLMKESGENPSRVISDVIVQAFAQQAHVIAHHSEGETPEDVKEIEDRAAELFEQRFGQSLEEAMGHSH